MDASQGTPLSMALNRLATLLDNLSFIAEHMPCGGETAYGSFGHWVRVIMSDLDNASGSDVGAGGEVYSQLRLELSRVADASQRGMITVRRSLAEVDAARLTLRSAAAEFAEEIAEPDLMSSPKRLGTMTAVVRAMNALACSLETQRPVL